MAIETPPLTTGPGGLPSGDRPRRWPWFVGLVLLGLVAGALTFVITQSSKVKVAESTKATAPATTVSDAALIKAYEDASAATNRASESLSVGPDDPALAATMTDPLLNYVRHQITDLHGQGIYYEPGGITNSNFHVIEKAADRAVIRLCETDKSYGYNRNGERLAAPGLPGKERAMEAIIVRDVSGTWKVSSRYPKDGGTECGAAA